jgi:hypothetical protein
VAKSKRSAGIGLQVRADFSPVIFSVGAAMAAIESLENPMYVNNIIEAAFNDADDIFNTEAAALGATGTIKHMFEWGTAGINRERTNMRPDPLTDRARLWDTTLTSMANQQIISYNFKQSIAIVPKPTKTRSGMDPDVIKKMKDFVFREKAYILESGSQVTIEPKGKFLLIPYNGQEWFKNYDVKRGYAMLMKGFTSVPGRDSMGNFDTFFLNYWENRGLDFMDEHIEKQVNMDFGPAVEINRQDTPTIAVPGSIISGIEKEKKKVAKKAQAKAKARSKKNDS